MVTVEVSPWDYFFSQLKNNLKPKFYIVVKYIDCVANISI